MMCPLCCNDHLAGEGCDPAQWLPATLKVGPGDVRRVHCETACDDYDVQLDPGIYRLRFTTVDFRPAEPGEEYWALAQVPCTRVRNGARFGKAGERGTYHYQAHAYTLRGKSCA